MAGAPTGAGQPAAAEPQSNSAAPAAPQTPAERAASDPLEHLLALAANAARSNSLAWIIFLALMLYLAMVAATVSHHDFLFLNPVKLPFFDIDLSIEAFAWLIPAFFLLVHACVLRGFARISRCARDFDAGLCSRTAHPAERDRMRRRLPNNLLVQIIAGPRRDGIFGLILWLIAAIVLGAAPVSLLVFFQLQFLPYHDAAMTWWQRGIVLADLVLLWRYWPRIGLPELEAGKNGWPLHRGFVETTQQLGTLAGMLLLSVGVGALALLIATFRGERLEAEFGSVSRIASLRRLVVAGELDANTHKPTSPWSDRLVLPNLDLTGRESPETGGTAPRSAQVVSLRGRRLEGAVLFGARLGSIDLTAAHLEGAMLGSADLRGAVLDEARLQGATLDGARLQGLRLVGVRLQGASLTDAHLEGAVLRGTRLEGAVLNAAHLQGALLEDVQLQGASLDRVELQSALLKRPQLQGASLVQAHLEGALIDGAQLQGATLDRVQVAGTLLRNAFVWRAYIRPAEPAAVRTEGFETGAKQRDAAGRITDWSVASWTDLKQRVASEAPRNAAVMTALWRLDRLNPEISLKDDQEAADQWARLQSQAPSLAVYEAASVATWRRIGCAEEGAPQVMANMVEALFSPQPLFPRDSVQPAALAAAFLQEGCVGANGLSDEQRARLKSLQERVVLKPAAAIVKPPAPAAKPN